MFGISAFAQTPFSTLANIPQEWVDYRQALRDIPQQEEFPFGVQWPAEPI